jgi:hypothetical protein
VPADGGEFVEGERDCQPGSVDLVPEFRFGSRQAYVRTHGKIDGCIALYCCRDDSKGFHHSLHVYCSRREDCVLCALCFVVFLISPLFNLASFVWGLRCISMMTVPEFSLMYHHTTFLPIQPRNVLNLSSHVVLHLNARDAEA